tara:strand:- start:1172 stop:1369 length:198 start_codon:yes stop_codon:yes gene_type:complete
MILSYCSIFEQYRFGYCTAKQKIYKKYSKDISSYDESKAHLYSAKRKMKKINKINKIYIERFVYL